MLSQIGLFINIAFQIYSINSSENNNIICSPLQNAVIHKCNSDCHNCDFDDTEMILNNCLDENGNIAYNLLCSDSTVNNCPIQYNDCDSIYVCPKITEITQCGDGGINGYTTYRLSLVIINNNIKNIYAIYGTDNTREKPLDIPPAYQGNSIFNSNIGGISNELIAINNECNFDSWLTIDITDGDKDNELGAVGLDFNSWTINNGIYNTNGAIFLLDPDKLSNSNEYTIAQITVPNDFTYNLKVNVQGKKKEITHDDNQALNDNSWQQEEIIFPISPPLSININTIPNHCTQWYDGCNICNVVNGIKGTCTYNLCIRFDNSRCLSFSTGH